MIAELRIELTSQFMLTRISANSDTPADSDESPEQSCIGESIVFMTTRMFCRPLS